MLINPETMEITALLDFEFTNVMPAQFAYDLPWWLILRQPGIEVSEGEAGKQRFLDLFEPRKEQSSTQWNASRPRRGDVGYRHACGEGGIPGKKGGSVEGVFGGEAE
jgi:hypothetical protein